MFEFTKTYPRPNEYTSGTNRIEYIVIHHTATKEGTTNGVIDGCMNRKDQASFHFLINELGESFKFGDPTDILRHAGESQRGNEVGLNDCSLGIELIGPLSDGGFTRKQFIVLCNLVQHLRRTYGIPLENVLKHSDITREGGKQKKLWDGESKARKVDPDRKLRSDRNITDFEAFRNLCF